MGAHARERHVSTTGMWADLGLTCTWCPADVVCDISIRECVSELDMCLCCRCTMTTGSVVRCSGSVLRALSVRFHYGSLPRWLATVSANPVYPVAGAFGAHRKGGGAVCAPPPQRACGGGLCAGPTYQLDW